ncbi:hypothetical protein [Mycobacteroides abscessus]|uniref:hypothetical protein n=1 Tax=Mycobacteroides abscessus TaxID=36809 RepID=UPI00104EFD0F|nr:hypothetical protein [Mycobacteroides abscessus]
MTVILSAQDASKLAAALSPAGTAMGQLRLTTTNGFELTVDRPTPGTTRVSAGLPGFTFTADLATLAASALSSSLMGEASPAPVEMSCYDDGLGDYIRIDPNTVATQPVYFLNEAHPGIAQSASGTVISE